MKAVVALCFLAVANAAVIPRDGKSLYVGGAAGVIPYTTGISSFGSGFIPYNSASGFTTYTAGAFPSAGFVPQTYGVLPTTYIQQAPAIQYQPVQTSVVAPGYVARTPGAEHVAPLPSGLGYASHHINLAKAPGTQ